MGPYPSYLTSLSSVSLVVKWDVLFSGYCEDSRGNAYKDYNKSPLNIVFDVIIYFLFSDLFQPNFLMQLGFLVSLGHVDSIQ